ncbi:MAG: RAMP superfamily CRISPR-associated protein, partial [Bacteroidota bacterium]
MRNQYIAFLGPNSTFRTPLRSDSLWGMICWGIRMVYGQNGNDKLNRYLNSCINGQPEFIISSTFPYTEFKDKKTLFFPRPFLPFPKAQAEKLKVEETELAIKNRKKLKKINFIPQDLFLRLVLGQLPRKELDKALLDENLTIPEVDNIHITHNTLDRRTWITVKENEETSGQLFHSEEQFLASNIYPNEEEAKLIRESKLTAPKSGLFFLIQGENLELLRPALRYLETTGFGADRNTG